MLGFLEGNLLIIMEIQKNFIEILSLTVVDTNRAILANINAAAATNAILPSTI